MLRSWGFLSKYCTWVTLAIVDISWSGKLAEDRERGEGGFLSFFSIWERVGEGRRGGFHIPVLSLFVFSFSCVEPLLFLWMGGVFVFFCPRGTMGDHDLKPVCGSSIVDP